jgi:thiamine-monophosphate kinase
MAMAGGSGNPDSGPAGKSGAGEFELIERIRARALPRPDVVLGIGDDAAIVRVPDGQELVFSTDTLVAGVHFPLDTLAADIGWKALAVNLSDLAAMGAEPAWISLALTLPESDGEWLDGFLDGFCELAAAHRVALVGGDTTRGPLSITLTAHGLLPAGRALRRDGARAGDEIWLTGTLGDAAGALRQWRGQGLQSAKLRYRLDRPTPRVAAGLALRGLASAAIDISDGLAADLGRLPTSRTLAEHFQDESGRWRLQLTGGDDYELCFTAAPAHALAIEQALAACDTPATVIGRIDAGAGLHLLRPDGEPFEVEAAGFQHFSGPRQ